MCAYQKINGAYSCGNGPVLNDAIKRAIGFKGWIMSDWKAVYGWEDALAGLDQHSGVQLDAEEWFVGPLRQAYEQGKFPKQRLSEMVRRILRSIFAVGIDRWDAAPAVDMAAHREAALETARQGIVLLKNDGALPLGDRAQRIAVIGGYAHLGALTGGGGSSLTLPPGGLALTIPLGGAPPLAVLRQMSFTGPSPVQELRRLLPTATITYNSGEHSAEAAALARGSDVAIVVAYKFESEGYDSPDLSLPYGQDELIAAVAAASPNTVVVLETGNPVAMPWREDVNAVVEAWYSGSAGGQAIAEVLAGAVNPSGHLPITFVANIEQTPHPELAGFGTPADTPIAVDYHEGAEIGYRWFAKNGSTPNFAFGHGLSYTQFRYSNFIVAGGDTVTASFEVTNTGPRRGADVPQVYLTSVAGERRMRLLGFERVELEPGESRRVTVSADPRLLARFDRGAQRWRIARGAHAVALGHSSGDLVSTADVTLRGRTFGR
jgi:beta-glucosidase